jgi:hypothetical protein
MFVATVGDLHLVLQAQSGAGMQRDNYVQMSGTMRERAGTENAPSFSPILRSRTVSAADEDELFTLE